MPRLPVAALAYAALSFAAAWLLGALRELGLAPVIGPTAALAIELPLFVGAMGIACRYSLRRFAVPPRPGARLAMGVAALLPVLLLETAGMMAARRLSLREFLLSFASTSGLLTLGLFAVFALLPAAFGLWEAKRPRNLGHR